MAKKPAVKLSKKRFEDEQEKSAILTFLKRTKEGEFAEVDMTSLEYVRISAMTEPNYEEDAYLFSYS
jgi:hypothetical protein